MNNFIHLDAKVIEGLKQPDAVNLSYLVVKDGDEVKGIFSERDYTRKVILQGRSSSDTTVKEIMTTDLPKVQLEDSVALYELSCVAGQAIYSCYE